MGTELLADAGAVLITGPSNAGKTRLTYAALREWVDQHGTEGVVVLEFAPELERDGRVLGGRLDRFGPIPDGVWTGVLEAHAPRSEGADDGEARSLAADNAVRAARLLEEAPAPRALFANDATIPFQHERGDLDAFLSYVDRADVAVLNAFESDELGTNDSVSQRERDALRRLKAAADRHVALEPGDGND